MQGSAYSGKFINTQTYLDPNINTIPAPVGGPEVAVEGNASPDRAFEAVQDAVHELQARLERGEDAESAVGATVSGAAERLAPFEVRPSAAEVTALLYLVDLATRYLADRQAESGARLGVLGTWLLPVLIKRIGEL